MIGLGRMGANIVRRLMRAGHTCVVLDRNYATVNELAGEGATGAASLDDFVRNLATPRAIWMMVPAAAVDGLLADLGPRLQSDDILIDGGNSCYIDDIRRAKELEGRGIRYLDVGTSGGVWGLERGYCQMIGGPRETFEHLEPIFKTLAPGRGNAIRTPGREKAAGTAEEGYLHCGPSGAGHFVKMVHNGIEYGLMAAYAEGINKARFIYEQTIGSKSPIFASLLSQEGLALLDEGQRTLAEQDMLQAVDTLAKMGPACEYRLATAESNFGLLRLRQRKFADAERLLTHALSLEERLPSRPVADMAATMGVLAQLRKAQRRDAESAQLRIRAAELQSGQ